MNMEDVVREVMVELTFTPDMADRAVRWATTMLPGSRKMAQAELTETQAGVMRAYFRVMIHRITFDPEYRAQLRREMQNKMERN